MYACGSISGLVHVRGSLSGLMYLYMYARLYLWPCACTRLYLWPVLPGSIAGLGAFIDAYGMDHN